MNCYLSRNYKGLNGAGNKAKTDIECTMQDMGFVNVGLKRTYYTHPIPAFLVTLLGIIKALCCISKGDILVLQYPLKKYFSFICKVARLKSVKIVVVIHDLGSFRRKKLTVKQEITRFAGVDYIIAHNEKMKQWLVEQGCNCPIGCLDVFDYLSSSSLPAFQRLERPFRILYAGALNPRKNKFLYEWGGFIHHYHVNLYGNGFELEKALGKEHFTSMGFVKSDELIVHADGDFGLVWDGSSVVSCTGDFGEYLQYNNPHKTSLYLRCGLPVIIWKKAALADFIIKRGLGLCIDSLEELDQLLLSVTDEQYTQMRNRVNEMSSRLNQGYFIRKALQTALEHPVLSKLNLDSIGKGG